jgi:hypothetical protein
VCLGVLLLVGAGLGFVASADPTSTLPHGGLAVAAGSFQITTWSFSPNPVSAGTQTQGMVTLSGGTGPYHLWFNNTPPGCAPPTNPETSSSPSYQFPCSPSSSGNYNVHLDALDSAAPPNRASQTASLSVNSNTGNGSGGGNHGGSSNSSSILPSGLLTILTYVILVFIATMVIIAAGVVAIAVMLSRRLRQLNETMAQTTRPSNPGKPPS